MFEPVTVIPVIPEVLVRIFGVKLQLFEVEMEALKVIPNDCPIRDEPKANPGLLYEIAEFPPQR